MPATTFPPPGVSAAESVRHVLYVEDHPFNVTLMEALFSQRPGLVLDVATTGEAGMRAALARTPDLLLLDLNLPDCHGVQLLAQMRGLAALANVPAIAVTADVVVSLDGTTFMEVWTKPLNVHHTLHRLDVLLGGHSSSQADGDDPAASRPDPVPDGHANRQVLSSPAFRRWGSFRAWPNLSFFAS